MLLCIDDIGNDVGVMVYCLEMLFGVCFLLVDIFGLVCLLFGYWC